MTSNKKIGECETCEQTLVNLELQHGDWMCQTCRDKERAVTENNRSLNVILDNSRKIDDSVQLNQDMFNAKTVAAIELKAAIWSDESIPVEEKEHTFAKECERRMLHFQQVSDNHKQMSIDAGNEAKMWKATAQSSVGRLHEKYRDQFKSLDVNYQPVVKTVKPKPVKAPTTKPRSRKFDSSVYELARKNDIDPSFLQFVRTAQNLPSYEAAVEYIKAKL